MVSMSLLENTHKKLSGLQSKYHHAIEKAHGVVHTAVRTAEVSAAAFGLGVYKGRMEDKYQHVMGVDVGLGSGLLLHVLGFAGIGGEYANHLHSFGDGALAGFLAEQGLKTGKEWQAKALAKKGASVRGELEEGVNGADLSDAELAAIARR